MAQAILSSQRLVDRVCAGHHRFAVVPALEDLGHLHLRQLFAWHRRQVVAIVHLVDADHVHTATHLGVVAGAKLVALAVVTLVCVVEKGRAVALVATPEAKELDTRHLPAEVVAHLRGHLLAVSLRHAVLVPDLLIGLRVEDTIHVHPASRATLLADRVWALEVTCVDCVDQWVQVRFVHLETKVVFITTECRRGAVFDPCGKARTRGARAQIHSLDGRSHQGKHDNHDHRTLHFELSSQLADR
jgi:hypothetical protein